MSSQVVTPVARETTLHLRYLLSRSLGRMAMILSLVWRQVYHLSRETALVILGLRSRNFFQIATKNGKWG